MLKPSILRAVKCNDLKESRQNLLRPASPRLGGRVISRPCIIMTTVVPEPGAALSWQMYGMDMAGWQAYGNTTWQYYGRHLANLWQTYGKVTASI